jgi:hypothetical protein
MRRFRPSLSSLCDVSLLSLAAKKAFRFLDSHQWYHDRGDAQAFMSRLTFHISRLSNDLRSGLYVHGARKIFPAPKRITKTGYVYRPLCCQEFRNEVVEVALLCLLADKFETKWGDSELGVFPDVVSFGNRLHLVSDGGKASFSVGNARIYRDWADDYSRFVRETERSFNVILTKLKQTEKVVLICTDLTSFYPTIRSERLRKIIRLKTKEDLWPIIDQIFVSRPIFGFGLDPTLADLSKNGLPQGPAQSGFWANVYLSEFDRWIVESLTSELNHSGITCTLGFYARYVDDMRLTFRCPEELTESLIIETKKRLIRKLRKIGLSLSESKTDEIIQDAAGSLLTTGQVAERMQSLTKQAYFPLPPEDLIELAKQVRLLFHTEIPAQTQKEKSPDTRLRAAEAGQVLDNPGVRSDSRRRFAANKWIGIARDIEAMGEDWTDQKRQFSQELVRVWLEDPGQIQLLRRAIEIGFRIHTTFFVVYTS